MNSEYVTFEHVVLGEGLAAVGAVKVSVLQMHKVRVPLDVAFRRETFTAQFAVILNVGMHRLDVLRQRKIVGKTFVTQAALVPVDSQVHRPLVLV